MADLSPAASTATSPTDVAVPDAVAIVAQWREHEKRIRAAVTSYGRVPPRELAASDGLTLMRRLLSGELPAPPIMQTLDFVLVLVDKGEAVFQGTPGPGHYNPIGSVHGGYIATLLDSAVGCAVHTALPQGLGYTTLELKVNYVRAVTDSTGPLRAVGKVINLSRQVGLAQGHLVDAAGRLYAHATTTCLVFPMPASGAAPSSSASAAAGAAAASASQDRT